MTASDFTTSRRALLRSALAAGALAAAPRAFAQDGKWPDRTIKVIVPYPAGGSTDVLVRILSEPMKQILGQSFIVENRPGAGGNIGITALVTAPPDGYTIGAATVGHFSINQYLYDKMPYDADKDLLAATMTWELPNVFAVASDHVPAKTLAEFVAWAKPRPQITFGSPGVGTTPHLSAALFSVRAGLKGVHIPFRGAAQTIPAMLSGDVNYSIDNLASYVGSIESGKIRPLAVTSGARWPTMPDVPTMKEAGFDDFVVTSWAAFVFPAKTPRAILDRLSETMKQVAKDEAIQKRFLQAGARVLASTPEEATAYGVRERPMWQEMVKVSGAKAE